MILKESTWPTDKIYQMCKKHQSSGRHNAHTPRARGADYALLVLLAGLLLGLAAPELPAQQEQFDMTLHRRMSTLTEPQSPTVIADRVLFTFGGSARATPAGEPPARYVAAAFAHEDFAQRHAYRIVRNETSDPDNPNETIETRVFALAYRIPPDLERLEYRIVVDGLWRTDPTNPNTTRDENGVLLSVFELPERPAAEAGVPRVYQDGRVEFIFEPEVGAGLQTIRDVMTEVGTEEGLNVYVAGSFNNWNPFMHRLRETETGVYRVTIPVPPGRHHYYLVINGQRILDPENGTRTRHRDGFQVCSFTVP